MSYGEVRSITPSAIAAFQKDMASANEVSMTGLQELYKASKNLHCLARTLTHVGDHMPALSVKRFMEDLCALCNSHSGNNKAASHWRKILKSCWQPPGNTRWWAKLVLYKKMIVGFEDLVLFCMTAEEDRDIERSVRIRRLAAVMGSHKQRGLLRFQLAAVTIAGGHLYSATYNLEGDNYCSLMAYDTIKDCENWLTDHYDYLTYPGLKQEMNDCVGTHLNGCEALEELTGDALFKDLEVQAKTILKGAVDYYHGTIMGKLASDIVLYKTCRYANCSLERRRPREPNSVSHYSHLSSPREGFSRLLPVQITNKATIGELNPRLLSVEPRVPRIDALPTIQATASVLGTHGSTDKSRGFNSPIVALFVICTGESHETPSR